MYRNLFLGVNKSYGEDGYPVVEEFQRLLDMETEGITNTSFTLTKETNETTYEADDITEVGDQVITGMTGTFSALGIDVKVKALIENNVIDKNGNLIARENGSDPRFTCCLQYKNKKGKSVQLWLYKVHFLKNNDTNGNQQSSQEDITYNFRVEPITDSEGRYLWYSEVVEGSTGWITGDPKPTDIYKEVPNAGVGG